MHTLELRGTTAGLKSERSLLGLLATIGSYFLKEHQQADTRLIYKLKSAEKNMNYYQKRILQLADGRSIEDVVEKLYVRELANGAGLVGIGFMEEQFRQEAEGTINRLIKNNFLSCNV